MSIAIAHKVMKEFRTPDGVASGDFRFLGSGVSRQVYLHLPTGKAYKLPYVGDENSKVNFHEAATSAWLRETFKLPGVIWPDFLLHDVNGTWVSEVTFFEDDFSVPRPVQARFADFLRDLGIGDASWGRNIFSCKGFAVPIDLGYHALCNVNPWDPKYWAEQYERVRKFDDETEIRRFGLGIDLCEAFLRARKEERRRARIAGADNPWNQKIPGCNCCICVDPYM